MAEPPTSETSPEAILPGVAEIFAIRYRTQWQALKLTPPDELKSDALKLQPPLTLETAALNVRRFLKTVDDAYSLPLGFSSLRNPSMYGLNLARLAMADLARAESLPDTPAVTGELLELLADSMEVNTDLRRLQDAYPDIYTVDNARDDDAGGRLPRFESRRFLELVRTSDDALLPNDRFFRAFTAPELRLLNGQRSAPPRLRNFISKQLYAQGVAKATAVVQVDRPANAFAKIIDPRKWNENVPSVWPVPTKVLTDAPQDRNLNGTSARDQERARIVDALFYEEAVFGVGVCPLSRHRNLLRITLDFEQEANRNFSYRQASCLTADIIGNPREAGGIDVDSGLGVCRDVEPGWCELKATKRLRFDLPADPSLNKMYNDINAVALPLLIESFVLFGAIGA